MPTYQYRCQSCHREQTIAHGMLEEMTVVCSDCGHFCQKITQSAPVVLSSNVPPMEQDLEASVHECGASCALHRHSAVMKSIENKAE